MKPEAIKRRAAKAIVERRTRRADLVTRLGETVLKHERAGDLKTAAHYAEMFVEAHDASAKAHNREGDDIAVVLFAG